MKKLFVLLAILLLVSLMVISFASCGEEATTTSEDTTEAPATTTTPVTTEGIPTYVDGKLFIIEDGVTNYKVTFAQGANKNSTTGKAFSGALTALRKAFKNYGFQSVQITNDVIPLGEEDTYVAPEFEILLGHTNRKESEFTDDLAFNQALIRVVGKKVVVTGESDLTTAMAIYKFIESYMPEDGKAVLIPSDLNEIVTVDFDICADTNMTYAEMAKDVMDAFNAKYWTENGIHTDFWHQAEMIETYVDIYEQTGLQDDKERMLAFADGFMREHGGSWLGNMYNDDIMWICIGFTRITKLTGEAKYARFAKSNFDQVWKRAWSNMLGGGLFWTTDNNTKNSCVNCPAAIAACLLGDVYGEEDYYNKAKQIMAWEIDVLFETDTGRVYDAININGGIGDWASTYNQGTFIGACTLLYQKTKDEAYLNYAEKAANYAMTKLVTNGVLDNGESTGNDLPGFKAILTRWLYRYAKEVESVDILYFLQRNAVVAYQNRNSDGLIWTKWNVKTSDDVSGYIVFGMSTALALMYNCQQWW